MVKSKSHKVLISSGIDKNSCTVLKLRPKSAKLLILMGVFSVSAFRGKIANLPGATTTDVPPSSANEVSANELEPKDISTSSEYIHNIRKKPPLSERLSSYKAFLS
jgi:hypothetical protein